MDLGLKGIKAKVCPILDQFKACPPEWREKAMKQEMRVKRNVHVGLDGRLASRLRSLDLDLDSGLSLGAGDFDLVQRSNVGHDESLEGQEFELGTVGKKQETTNRAEVELRSEANVRLFGGLR